MYWKVNWDAFYNMDLVIRRIQREEWKIYHGGITVFLDEMDGNL